MNRTALILLALAALLATSCGEDTGIVRPHDTPSPVPNSPINAMRLLEWSWDNCESAQLPGLFPDDYRFVFALGDSAGNAYRDQPWTREDELIASRNCFAAAYSLEFETDPAPVVLDDDRPGKNPRWHKTIRTSASLLANVSTGFGPVQFEVTGHAKFYFVRGDSALIPAELVAAGYQPDSTVWWMDRWEDETLPAGASSAHPAVQMSWGAFKMLFR